MSIAHRLALLAGFAALAAQPLAAATRGPMRFDGRLLVEDVAGVAGAAAPRRTLRMAAQARSGDMLVFLVRYRNDGVRALPGYDIVVPVPRGVRILPGRDDALRVSTDGGRSWSRPDAAFRFDARGHLRPAADIAPTHVRLRLTDPIAPGAGGTVAYRGQLL